MAATADSDKTWQQTKSEQTRTVILDAAVVCFYFVARKELSVAFKVILQRLDNMQLACAEEDLFYAPNVLLRGLSSLPIRFTARTD